MARQPAGLPTLNQARADRRRQITTGKARIGGLPPQFFLWALVILGTMGVLYYRKAQSELEGARSALMAKQRAVAQSLGPKLLPIRDKIEAAAQQLSGPYAGDRVATDLSADELGATPSVYLRLRLQDARDVEKLREAAARSLRDGFTSCLYRDPSAKPPAVGAACTLSSACQPGELCNEYQVCQRPSQPFNVRLVYRALKVLSSKWTDEVHQAKNELAISAYEGGLDSVTRVDVPAAIEVYQRAKLFTLVLDEEPQGGLPPAPPPAQDAGDVPPVSDYERLQSAPHWVRVGIFDLKTGEPLVRLRTQAAGELRAVGSRRVQTAEAEAARQRQANSCSAALAVRAQLPSDKGGGVSDGAPSGSGTPAPPATP